MYSVCYLLRIRGANIPTLRPVQDSFVHLNLYSRLHSSSVLRSGNTTQSTQEHRRFTAGLSEVRWHLHGTAGSSDVSTCLGIAYLCTPLRVIRGDAPCLWVVLVAVHRGLVKHWRRVCSLATGVNRDSSHSRSSGRSDRQAGGPSATVSENLFCNHTPKLLDQLEL